MAPPTLTYSTDMNLPLENATQLQQCSAAPVPRDREVLNYLAGLSYRSGDLRPYLKALADGVSSLVAMDWAVVTLCEGERETVLASSINLGASDTDPVYHLHGTLTGTVFNSGETLVVPDAVVTSQYGAIPEGYRSYLGVPLRAPQGDILGTICCFHGEPRSYDESDVRIAELFAERAAVALDNYRLYQQQQALNADLADEVARQTEALRLAQARAIERERLSAIGAFATSIVHELRNPTTTIKMALEFLGARVDLDGGAQQRLDLALDEFRRLERLLGEILLYAKPQVLVKEVVPLERFLAQLSEEFEFCPRGNVNPLQLVVQEQPLLVAIDCDKFKQVMLNLLGNACEASPPNTTITCRASLEGDRAVVCVINGGEPIPPEILPRLTEPFFTTKAEGTGLGLAIVKRIVAAHDGEFELTSSAATGTIARVSLPQARLEEPVLVA